MAVRSAVMEWKPDVVHCHWTYEYARGVLATGLPSLITAHDVPTRLFHLVKPRYYHWPKLLQAFLVVRRAPLMSAQSPYTLNLWKSEMKRALPIELVPNGIKPDLLLLRTTELPSEPIFASINEGFQKRKNVETLLEAFSLVLASVPEARLKLFGANFGRGEPAELWAEKRGLTKNVEFVGQLRYNDLLQELARSVRVVVHPALEESFGMSVLESMALGLPVIGGANSGAVPWLLDEGKAGLVCDISSADALAKTMVSGLSRADLGACARERAKTHFRLDHIAKRYLELLERPRAAVIQR